MAKKLEDLTHEEFDKLKKANLLHNIYPEAPDRFEQLNPIRPVLLDNPDWDTLKNYTEYYMDNLNKGHYTKDFEHYLCETVMTTLYGPDVFDYINAKNSWD